MTLFKHLYHITWAIALFTAYVFFFVVVFLEVTKLMNIVNINILHNQEHKFTNTFFWQMCVTVIGLIISEGISINC